jgi:hypothetical protein
VAATREESRRTDRTRLLQAIAVCFLAAILPTVITFLRVGGT